MTREQLEIYRKCGSKVRYESAGPAYKALKRSKWPHMNVYECRHCHGFHVGTSNKRR